MSAKFRAVLAILAVLALLSFTPASQAQSVMVTLTIIRVRQIENLEGAKPGEFYVKVRIGARNFAKTRHRKDRRDAWPNWPPGTPPTFPSDPHRKDGRNVSRNWTFNQSATRNSTVPISIAILERHAPDADGHCDVSPAHGKRTLEISYDLATGRISGDVTGNEGALIHARGEGESDSVEIWFRLTQSPAPLAPATNK